MLIYLTTNNLKEKIYIGKLVDESKSTYLGSGTYVGRAIKKYGKENFSRITLEDGITDHDYLCERERYWIAFYDSTNPEIGYNLCDGGGGTLGYKHSEETKNKMSENRPDMSGENHYMFGKHHSKKTCEKMSESAKNRSPITEETRKKMAESNSGKNHPMFRKHRSEETKNKISEKLTGKTNMALITKKEIVLKIIDLSHEKIKQKDVAKIAGVSIDTVRKVQNGEFNKVYNLKKEEYLIYKNKISYETILEIRNLLQKKMTHKSISEIIGVSQTIVTNIKNCKGRFKEE